MTHFNGISKKSTTHMNCTYTLHRKVGERRNGHSVSLAVVSDRKFFASRGENPVVDDIETRGRFRHCDQCFKCSGENVWVDESAVSVMLYIRSIRGTDVVREERLMGPGVIAFC